MAIYQDHRNSDDRVTYIPEQSMNTFTTICGTIIALGFLIGAIWSLWHTSDLEKKLAAVTGFIIGFGLVVGFLTNARRTEIFAATAAYAAVLIIYVAQPPGK
jgi:hypothetical protein